MPRRDDIINKADAPMKYLLAALLFACAGQAGAQALYQFQAHQPRWISPENPTGQPGHGALENHGAKGHAFDTIPAGGSLVLGRIKGSGVIHRIWITIGDRSPQMLRSLRLDIYWDGARTPAVSVPFGDFFGMGTGRTFAFQNALFSSPEGRSFNTIIPMPFRKGARLVLTNQTHRELKRVFYDIDYTRQAVGKNMLYFHANWRREHRTKLGHAFRILPHVDGRGRFLGVSVALHTNPAYKDTWWGEGEMQVYLDGDSKHPTLSGTGSEDYLGSGWGLGKYINRYQGTPVADAKHHTWQFYRFHVPDPIFFSHGCEVRLQQIGGAPKKQVQAMLKAGVPLKPISIDPTDRSTFVKLLDKSPVPKLDNPDLPKKGWTNFYRSDDVAATVYFYLDKPGSPFAPLAPVQQRVRGIQAAGKQ